ncbi:MAG TPA: FGLLP motif-containing membrane protein [Candidatus Dormibacteraeota bacterium]|nr:FGLLP motif-containing membrane protein [Candidatus Dormibacteraeota bacterium]
MRAASKLLLTVAIAGICLCTFAPAAATASAPPIGDSCLVGRWVETQRVVPSNYWQGQSFPIAGFRGLVITFNADGTETDDASASAPLTGDQAGHHLEFVYRGQMLYHVHANGAELIQSAPVGSLRPSYYFDGQQIQGGEGFLPATYTYRCTAKTLHRERPPYVAGYGPTVDDLVRPAGAGSPGSFASTVSSSLSTPSAVIAAPVTLLVSAAIALAAVLLITFPSHLFNRTYEENHEVIRYWWERRFRWLLRLRLGVLAGGRRRSRDGFAFLAVVLCGGVLAALLDPRFGWSLRTLALFAGAVFALLAGSLVSFFAAGSYRVLRHKAGPWRLHALPSGLAVAAVCVLVSRLANFQPGYLYGLIGGVVFAGALSKREEGHVVAVTSLVTLSLALAAWIAWVPVSVRSTANPSDFGWALASNFLAALFVSGMVGLLIGLVPLRFLPGEKLAGWHRGVWGAVFGVAALSVIEVMLRPQTGGTRSAPAPLWVTGGLFLAFGVVSVLFWSYFRMRRGARARELTTSND